MEIVLDEEWESLSQMFSSSSADFLLHCDGFSTNLQIPSPTLSPSHPNPNPNPINISQQSNEIDQALFLGNHHHTTNDGFMLPDDVIMEEFLRLKPINQEMTSLQDEDKSEDFSAPRKRPRNPYKSRAAQSKKTIQEKNNEEQGNGGGGNKESCSSYSSEDESSAKTRATRGSATDPQSLYARKRRERINERLKILQNLVPNGTKVDISTMLEEAVQYVKFLQLQIKLLSSDNLWMYAPLAYNGMDIGIYQNISPDLRP